MKRISIILTLLLACGSFGASAQIGNYFDKFRPAKQWSLGLHIGPTHTMSDADNFVPGLAFGGHVKYSVSQTFGLKLNAGFGTLNGDRTDHDISGNGGDNRNKRPGEIVDGKTVYNRGDQAPTEDTYFFTNNFREVNVNMVFTLGNLSFLRPLRKTQIFLFAGFGAIWSNAAGGFTDPDDAVAFYDRWGSDFFTPVYDNNNDLVDAESIYEGTNFVIPFGVGFKRNISKLIDLGLEYRMNYTRSDNLDAFSFPIWRNRVFDFYGILGVQASIKLGGKDGVKEHYDWLNPVGDIYKDMDTLKMIKEKMGLILIDSDSDGVADLFDKEKDTDKDAFVWGNGVAADIDEDGVPDHIDKERFSEKGATVNKFGVMIDVDGDKVPDYRDKDTKTIIGTVITPQGDNPTINTTVIGGGGGSCCDCNDVILPSVIFDAGSSKVKPEFIGVLYSVAEKMKSCPDLQILITGYSYRNKSTSTLSFQRATAIVDYLNNTYNIPRDRFSMDTEGSAPSGLDYAGRRIDLFKIR